MVLVLCSRWDASAHNFVTRFSERDLQILTCAGVSQQGWKIAIRGKHRAAEVGLTAAIGGKRVNQDHIEGVITRLAYVSEKELGHIVPDDRSYVAAEMHAFLFAFLEALPCRIVNRPSLACLYGPNMRAVQWRRYARELDIPVKEDLRTLHASTEDYPTIDVTVIDERTIGNPPQRALQWTRQLARRVGVSYLTARYADLHVGLCFVGVDTYPNLESEEIASTLVDSFRRNV